MLTSASVKPLTHVCGRLSQRSLGGMIVCWFSRFPGDSSRIRCVAENPRLTATHVPTSKAPEGKRLPYYNLILFTHVIQEYSGTDVGVICVQCWISTDLKLVSIHLFYFGESTRKLFWSSISYFNLWNDAFNNSWLILLLVIISALWLTDLKVWLPLILLLCSLSQFPLHLRKNTFIADQQTHLWISASHFWAVPSLCKSFNKVTEYLPLETNKSALFSSHEVENLIHLVASLKGLVFFSFSMQFPHYRYYSSLSKVKLIQFKEQLMNWRL